MGRLVSPVKSGARRGLRYVGPVIEERLRKYEEYGREYPDKPVGSICTFLPYAKSQVRLSQNDMLSWLMDDADDCERQPWNLMIRVLALNVGSIHTSSMVRIGAAQTTVYRST